MKKAASSGSKPTKLPEPPKPIAAPTDEGLKPSMPPQWLVTFMYNGRAEQAVVVLAADRAGAKTLGDKIKAKIKFTGAVEITAL